MTDLTLTVTRTINASAEQIYKAWLDPDTIRKFMAGGSDQTVAEAQSDPREGGAFFILMVSDKEVPHRGIYKTLTPFSRLVFSWESPYSPADSEVEILLRPVDGGTEVTLHQVKFLSEGARDGHFGGWTQILARLDGHLVPAAA